MKAIVVLADTLNRRYLGSYGNAWVEAPNIERFAGESVVFDNHWVGSSPCMPARRDIFTGRLEFLERSWGPLEPFDVPFPKRLREHGIYSHLITDHYPYFWLGGEGYCQSFDTWDLIRGQLNDPWASRPEPRYSIRPGPGPAAAGYEEAVERRRAQGLPDVLGMICNQYDLNKERFEREGFPCERTFGQAVRWLEENHEADDYFLMIETFTPHEPFDPPQRFKALYPSDYSGPDYTTPSYSALSETGESVEAIAQLRRNYAANVSFFDECFGRFLDTMDRLRLWEDTLVIFTTDHGHLLGEHGFSGKELMPEYNELNHIPLMVRSPARGGGANRCAALTQNIDIYPTLLEYFGVEPPSGLHGKSWLPLLRNETESLREAVLYGTFGHDVNLTDGGYTYFRTHAAQNNRPLFLYTAMPTTFMLNPALVGDESWFEKVAMGRFLARTRLPVYKVPVRELWLEDRYLSYCRENMLFDLASDYAQERNLSGGALEAAYARKLMEAMAGAEAPEEQYLRLGLG